METEAEKEFTQLHAEHPQAAAFLQYIAIILGGSFPGTPEEQDAVLSTVADDVYAEPTFYDFLAQNTPIWLWPGLALGLMNFHRVSEQLHLDIENEQTRRASWSDLH